MVRKPDATMQPTPQDNQLMSKHRVLSLKPQLRLEWRGQDGQNETEQPDHSASLGDSITSSTQMRFSVHTGGRLYDADRSDIIWQADDIREFCSVASVELQAALLLALWTGQRQSDLLKLSWKNYDGKYIRLRQTKAKGQKGRRATIPVGAPLQLGLGAALKQRRSAA